MAKGDTAWVENGEKYAIIGMKLNADRNFRYLKLPGDLIVLSDAAFALPDFWTEWLGTARVENVEDCSLFLLAKMPSTTLDIVDEESQTLERRVYQLFLGLILASKFTAFQKPFLAIGSRANEAIDVRSFGELDRPIGSIVHDSAPIGETQLQKAARIAGSLRAFNGPWKSDHWRFFRCYSIYQTARINLDLLDRIHQFARCIEGLINSQKGETKRQFKSRTELFIGPRDHKLMGELYDVRSDIEHLHEHKYLATRDRDARIRLAELEAISEWISRSCIARILLNPDLMLHFGSVNALAGFWAMPEKARQSIWGPPVDAKTPLQGFRFDYVSDQELGVG